MSVLIKTVGFSLGLTLVFTGVANLLPQVEGDAPVDVKVDLSALTMDDFVAMGEDLFNNKGTCTLCHKPAPLGRAPDVQGMDMVATAADRLVDTRYAGKATSAAEYFRESMLEPSEYVVAGWGKKGSDDKESPMPAVDKPPIQLSSIEIDAIIAYLQAKDGNEVTVTLPSPDAAASVAKSESEKQGGGAAPAPAATAEEALAKYTCTACHALDSDDTLVGPGLGHVGARLSEGEIRQSIIDPNAVIAEGFPAAMPGDFAEKMTVKELEMIVKLLAEKKQ